jgi:hypothetical protein
MNLHVDDDDEDDEASASPADAGDMSAAVRCLGMILAGGSKSLLLVVVCSLSGFCSSSGFNFLLQIEARKSASCSVQAGWL